MMTPKLTTCIRVELKGIVGGSSLGNSDPTFYLNNCFRHSFNCISILLICFLISFSLLDFRVLKVSSISSKEEPCFMVYSEFHR
ncbi:unnamed protein product [Citrullus colocynthis]|uniref:Uncharacterized protein n=1 Tax=Citrullus colocynthis TaxID=252529 RepID=A0ABP0XZP7_9ROSI